jgi:tight adherence protein C
VNAGTPPGAVLLAVLAGIAASAGVREAVGGRLTRALRSLVRRAANARPRRRIAAPGAGWMPIKVVCGVVATAFGLLVAGGPGGRVAILLALAAPVAGFFAPDLYAARQARRRQAEAARDLPDMLDLLRVAVEAGMTPARALGIVAAEFRGPLAFEWRRVAAEVSLGESQDRALRAFERRLPSDEIGALVEALRRTRHHGTPLGRVLATQAARARHRRHQLVRERAARAGPKIQLAVALLLVPSVLLMVAAATLAELERSGAGLLTY